MFERFFIHHQDVRSFYNISPGTCWYRQNELQGSVQFMEDQNINQIVTDWFFMFERFFIQHQDVRSFYNISPGIMLISTKWITRISSIYGGSKHQPTIRITFSYQIDCSWCCIMEGCYRVRQCRHLVLIAAINT